MFHVSLKYKTVPNNNGFVNQYLWEIGEYFSHFTHKKSYSRPPIKLLSVCVCQGQLLAPTKLILGYNKNKCRKKPQKVVAKWFKKYFKFHDLIKADFWKSLIA